MDTVDSIQQLLIKLEQKKAEEVYLNQPIQGQWHQFTWAEVMRQARQVAQFLFDCGLKKGDRVSIYSKNCAEWFIADFGITLAGMVSVPLFPNQDSETLAYVLSHAGVRLVFVGKLDDFRRARKAIPDEYMTVSFLYHPEMQTSYDWHQVLACKALEQIELPSPDDLFTIIYTSGTSKLPKGAMYTHRCVTQYLNLFPQDLKRISTSEPHRLVSYLPLAHVYERTAIQFASLTFACEVFFVESLDKFVDNLQYINPTLFTAVPRIWGVFKSRIEQKISPKLLSFLLYLPWISKRLKVRIQKKLGLSEAQYVFSGAAHLPQDIINFFERLGLFIQEGYGQSENFAYATLSLLDHRRPGFVGEARLGVSLKLSDEHELLISSPCLMSGYWRDQEATQQAFTEDGMLRSGDLAEIDHHQVKILGRLSEIFKNQKGEFIAPSPIEQRFLRNKWIDYCCLMGSHLPSNVLLLRLSDEAQKQDKHLINESLKHSLHIVNAKLKTFEKVSYLIIVADAWTPSNNILTPTLKIKRRVLESMYLPLIEQVFHQKEIIYWAEKIIKD